MRPSNSLARLCGSAALTAMLAAGLAGCQTTSDVTGSLKPSAEAGSTDSRSTVEVYGERYRANPGDADVALAYGQALRASGQHATQPQQNRRQPDPASG